MSSTTRRSSSSATSSLYHISGQPSSEEYSTESYSSLSDASEDDEVVYSISDLSVISVPQVSADDLSSDEDFVLLGRSESPATVHSIPSGFTSLSASIIDSQKGASSVAALSDVFSHLQVEDSDSDNSVRPTSQATTRRRTRRGRGSSAAAHAAAAGRSQTKTSTLPPPQSASTKAASPKKRKKRTQPTNKAAGVGNRPIVDDVSESGEIGADTSASFYQDAVQYISTFLSMPAEETKGNSDLTLLQALIIELGLCPTTPSAASEQSFCALPSLPRSLRAAKALLKSRVFVNVRDYLDVRHKGLDALQGIMHPSRKALVKDLGRGKGKRKVPRDFVKNSGLGVLLVTCYQ